jgi:two-component system copper resistance phosphate regulon response regulator CusR
MKILIIEDDTRIAHLIQRGLQEQGYTTKVVYDGEEAIRSLASEQYDLIVTDVLLPLLDGLSVCREVRRLYPAIPLLILTALGTTDDKVDGFDAGADDYLVKPFEMRELVARIKALSKRGAYRTETLPVLVYADLEMNLHTKTVTRSGTEISLTPKEFKLLQYMLQNPERVLSRAEIAEKVWDTHFDTGTNFIDVYINYLRKKIDKDFGSKLLHTKPGMGFFLKILS